MAENDHLNTIKIRKARTHNLKNIDVDIPRNSFTVITGLSGSGKSSLAFDTLYAEGQRRYVESLSAYARQFLSMMEKPDVDLIEGLSPAIAIEQKATSHNPRSTVGTITEIYDYLRLLFARAGEARCPTHNLSLNAKTVSQMVDEVLTLPKEAKAMILAPIVQERKGEHVQKLKQLQAQGFVKVRINGEIYEIDSPPTLALHEKHNIEVVVDRFRIKEELAQRLSESFETALKLADGLVFVVAMENEFPDLILSAKYACPKCGFNISELEVRLFSFNSPKGACPDCDGLGVNYIIDKDTKPLYGREEKTKYLFYKICPGCNGSRLSIAARSVFVAHKSMPQLVNMPIDELLNFFTSLKLEGARGTIASKINQEITSRLSFLNEVGLAYLTLNRSAETLSGGEAQRIRLASQIGSGLVGVMYVLDEPSIGLHQRDNARLLNTLKKLRDLGNTVIVVEHDEDAILSADNVIDIGPFAGVHGGEVVATGPAAALKKCPQSLTGQYLARKLIIAIPKKLTFFNKDKVLQLRGVSCHNLKNIDVDIPIGLFTCITGVSGSGKSSLINDTLYPLAANNLNHSEHYINAEIKAVHGFNWLDNVIDIDQSPIGRTPRSNPATYTGVFTHIRDLFAQTHEARSRGYQIGRFSFNVKGGRCEACEGEGVIRVSMHFLPDVFVPCDLCQGKRYNRETLDILYKGKNIDEVLNLTVEEARSFFSAIPQIAKKCQTMIDVGLSYIRLGQSATTLSGGEAQRIKLSKELSKRSTGRTLYILDEPTTGLHFHDVNQLLIVLHRLRDQGNTIIVIEHHLDVIKTADWIIDLGPEGGHLGGQIIAQGTPKEVAKVKHSYTGQFLKKILPS
ncbi:MAG: ABC-ATPase UvrA [Legionellales bacterium RIFCSPHIGHO2_12_FULL_37_14]|nr:MAG: ABC-ATPase UvrA [Legionellales bacterium RIFCSPHIGHO2_12_FULL_37_14]